MNRISKISFNILLILLFCGMCFQLQSGVPEKNQPSGLSINFLTHAEQVFLNGYPTNTPLVQAIGRRENFQFAEIAQKRPFFGWVVNSDQNNTIQTAYQIIVASSLENIQRSYGDFWDSGKTESGESQNVSYSGKELMPNSVYFWKVKTWDNHGSESSYSTVSQFKTAAKLVDYATAQYSLQKQDVYPATIKSISASETFIDFGKAAIWPTSIDLIRQVWF